MLGIYFSGTGNSKYALSKFLLEYDSSSKMLSIEDCCTPKEIEKHDELVFSYPVQYSTVPKILRDFISENQELWRGKKVFVIATMGLFSGDGAGVLARLLKKYGAEIVGGLHLKMPDSIADEKAMKRPLDKNKELVKQAEEKIKSAVIRMKSGEAPQEGIGFLYRMTGLFGQRLYFGYKTKNYSDRLKIDSKKCVCCAKCAAICPMNNIRIADGKAVADNRCTMCYRCINYCPKQAITLLGRAVAEQSRIEKFI